MSIKLYRIETTYLRQTRHVDNLCYAQGYSEAEIFGVQTLGHVSNFNFCYGMLREWHRGLFTRAAYPTFVRKFANTIRDLFVNRFNLAVALTTAAVAARGI